MIQKLVLISQIGILSVSAAVIDFNSITESGPGSGGVVSPYIEQGFRLTDSGGLFFFWQTGSPSYFGQTALIQSDTDFVLERLDAEKFNFEQISVAPGADFIDYAQNFVIVGHRPDGSTVSQMVVVPGQTSFATIGLVGFTGLSSVTWSIPLTDLVQFTNLNVLSASEVPEPSSAQSLIVGLAGLTFLVLLRRRRQGLAKS